MEERYISGPQDILLSASDVYAGITRSADVFIASWRNCKGVLRLLSGASVRGEKSAAVLPVTDSCRTGILSPSRICAVAHVETSKPIFSNTGPIPVIVIKLAFLQLYQYAPMKEATLVDGFLLFSGKGDGLIQRCCRLLPSSICLSELLVHPGRQVLAFLLCSGCS